MATRRAQAADQEPGGFACKLVLRTQSRSGRRVEPVEPRAGCPGVRQHPGTGRLVTGTRVRPGRPVDQGHGPGSVRARMPPRHARVEARTQARPAITGPGHAGNRHISGNGRRQ